MARRVRPTMRQVAIEAGVSVATVSNALNGTGRLSEPTRLAVLAATERLGYQPYATLRAGGRGGTGLLGLTMTTHGDELEYTQVPFYSQLILGTIAAARRRGYLLVVLPSTLPDWAWLATPLDGVIQVEPRHADPVGAILTRRGIARVMVGRPVDPRPDDVWVDTDDAAITRDLLDRLHGADRRRVGFVMPEHDDAFPEVVHAAYVDWCVEHRQPPMVERFRPAADYESAERATARRLLLAGVGAAFGIYTASGRHLLLEADALGLRVPADVRLACFSEDPGYAWTDPPITTVGLVPERLGAAAVDQLIGVLDQRSGRARRVLLDAELNERASTGG